MNLSEDNDWWWATEACELPPLPEKIDTLFLDFETSSNSPLLNSLNPWRRGHCSIIGAAITWDDMPAVYFVERHLLEANGWLCDVLSRARAWVNHNIKYDVHVLDNDLGLRFKGEYHDTMSLAKIYDCDRSYRKTHSGYKLESLGNSLLDEDIGYLDLHFPDYIITKPKAGKKKNLDYSAIPKEQLAPYACGDAWICRKIYRYLLANLPPNSDWVWQNEIRLIATLIDVERRGLQIDKQQLKIQFMLSQHRLLKLLEELNEKVGYLVLPNSWKDMHELLVNKHCYPQIFDEKKKKVEGVEMRESFDIHTLKRYEALPSHPNTRWLIKLLIEYRREAQMCNLYWEPWLELSDDNGILHSDYNPNVRSGRLSAKTPNPQQLNLRAKSQIRARKGRKLICFDYSQLEYRWMMHYLQNKKAIKAYNENPETDYHQWVADELCGGIGRSAAKTLNFTIGFGGGKNRVKRMLSLEPAIIKAAEGDPMRIGEIALKVFNRYHRNLPELKEHSNLAQGIAEKNGHVKTLYGRRLPLPSAFARKGFNRVIQSTAADNAKEAMNDASPTHNKILRDLDVHLCAQVHDEYLYDVPDDPEVIAIASAEINRCLEAPSKRCRVPILAKRGAIADTWKEAKP